MRDGAGTEMRIGDRGFDRAVDGTGGEVLAVHGAYCEMAKHSPPDRPALLWRARVPHCVAADL